MSKKPYHWRNERLILGAVTAVCVAAVLTLVGENLDKDLRFALLAFAAAIPLLAASVVILEHLQPEQLDELPKYVPPMAAAGVGFAAFGVWQVVVHLSDVAGVIFGLAALIGLFAFAYSGNQQKK